jgi:hypothetical protein
MAAPGATFVVCHRDAEPDAHRIFVPPWILLLPHNELSLKYSQDMIHRFMDATGRSFSSLTALSHYQ